MSVCVGGIFVKGVGPCLFFFSPCFCLLLLVYDFWSCLGNFITGVNSVKQQTLIDSSFTYEERGTLHTRYQSFTYEESGTLHTRYSL
jgi:hypothetical protein